MNTKKKRCYDKRSHGRWKNDSIVDGTKSISLLTHYTFLIVILAQVIARAILLSCCCRCCCCCCCCFFCLLFSFQQSWTWDWFYTTLIIPLKGLVYWSSFFMYNEKKKQPLVFTVLMISTSTLHGSRLVDLFRWRWTRKETFFFYRNK